jgi:hypothetical protein
MDVARAYDAEVSVVKGGDLVDALAFGYREDGCAGGSEGQVAVCADEFGHAGIVVVRQVDRGEVAVGDRLQEIGLNSGSGLSCEEVADLGDNPGRARGARGLPGRPACRGLSGSVGSRGHPADLTPRARGVGTAPLRLAHNPRARRLDGPTRP